MRVPAAEATRIRSRVGSLSVAMRSRGPRRSVSGNRPGEAVGREQLLGEEGVSTSARVDRVDEIGIRLVAEDACQLVGLLGPVEAGELDPLGASTPFQLRQNRQQGDGADGFRRCDSVATRRSGRRAGCGPGTPAARASSDRPNGCPRRTSATGPRRLSRRRNSRRCSKRRPCPAGSGAAARACSTRVEGLA